MLKLSQYSLMAGLMLVVLALVCYILVLTMGRSVRRAPVMASVGGGAGGGSGEGADDAGTAPLVSGQPRALALYGTSLTRLALVFLTACLVFRAIGTGHGPFTKHKQLSFFL